jgi:hypothetical protein
MLCKEIKVNSYMGIGKNSILFMMVVRPLAYAKVPRMHFVTST